VESFLRPKFDAVFPTELDFKGMSPPSGGVVGKLLNLVQLAEFKSVNGWLTIGYELKAGGQQDNLAVSESSASLRR
jgi:hypothetical protein